MIARAAPDRPWTRLTRSGFCVCRSQKTSPLCYDPSMTNDNPVDLAFPASLALAAAVWDNAIAAMTAAGTLDAACLPALQRMCSAWLRWKEAETHLMKEGAVVPAPKSGVAMLNPWSSVAKAASAELRKLEIELGLLPARRGRAARSPAALDRNGTPAPPPTLEAWGPETESS